MYLIQCHHCGKIYKATGRPSVKGLQYITDYNDNVTNKCIVCKKEMEPIVMKTQDWIANLVFTVKGN